MNTILHIINKSVFTHQALRQCLKCYKDSDSLLFVGDGVYCALNSHEQAAKLSTINHCYALVDDIDARGIDHSTLLDNIQLIDDKAFVELSISNPLSQSWF